MSLDEPRYGIFFSRERETKIPVWACLSLFEPWWALICHFFCRTSVKKDFCLSLDRPRAGHGIFVRVGIQKCIDERRCSIFEIPSMSLESPRWASKKPRCHQQASKCIPWGVGGTFIWVCFNLRANCFLNPFKQHFGKIANSLNCTFTLKSRWDLLLKALQSHLHKALQIYGQMFYIFVWQIDLQIKKIMESKTRHNYEKYSHTFFFDFINVKILKMSSRPFSRKGVSRKGVSRTLDDNPNTFWYYEYVFSVILVLIIMTMLWRF